MTKRLFSFKNLHFCRRFLRFNFCKTILNVDNYNGKIVESFFLLLKLRVLFSKIFTSNIFFDRESKVVASRTFVDGLIFDNDFLSFFVSGFVRFFGPACHRWILPGRFQNVNPDFR